MKVKSKQSGITLTEMMVVVAVVALLVSFGLPAVRTFLDSLASSGSTKAMISAGLASARAIAAKEQRYAGIRFQKAYNPDDPLNPLNADQYMIFVVHEEPSKMGDLTIGFRAVEGIKPIRLPDLVGVMDLRIRTNLLNVNDNSDKSIKGLTGNESNNNINDPEELRDTTSFSVIFSPSGKLVINNVRVRNKDGKTEGTEGLNKSKDDVFNTLTKITHITNPYGMFIQDDYPDLGLGKELSRNSFIIYDRGKFRQAYEKGQAYSGYLAQLAAEMIYINPYTGTIISRD